MSDWKDDARNVLLASGGTPPDPAAYQADDGSVQCLNCAELDGPKGKPVSFDKLYDLCDALDDGCSGCGECSFEVACSTNGI